MIHESQRTTDLTAGWARILAVLSLAALLVAHVLGCPTDEDEDEDPPPIEIEDEVVAHISTAVPTVVIVSWPAPADEEVVAAEVRFGQVEAMPRTALAELDDGNYTAYLFGLKPDRDVYYEPEITTAGGSTIGYEMQTITTGSAPSGLPNLEVTLYDDSQHFQGFLLTSILSVPPVPVIIDRDGDYVWWWVEEGFPPRLSRTMLSHDGRSILFQFPSESATFLDPSDLVRMSIDGTSYEPVAGAIKGHHDFIELEDGTIALFMVDKRDVDQNMVTGDRIVELSQDGTETEIWNVWDHETYESTMGLDWSHANALNYDEEQGVYYASMRNFDTIYKIDRATGDVLWRLGGDQSDFDFAGSSNPEFHKQHQFEVLDGGILVFDNSTPENYYSRAIEFVLDEQEMQATHVWEYLTDPPIYTYGLGDVHRFENGNTMVVWSTSGMIDEVDANGELIWRVSVELGSGMGYAQYMETLYVSP